MTAAASRESNRAIARILGPLVPGDLARLGETARDGAGFGVHTLYSEPGPALGYAPGAQFSSARAGELCTVVAVRGDVAFVLVSGSGRMGWTLAELLERVQ